MAPMCQCQPLPTCLSSLQLKLVSLWFSLGPLRPVFSPSGTLCLLDFPVLWHLSSDAGLFTGLLSGQIALLNAAPTSQHTEPDGLGRKVSSTA